MATLHNNSILYNIRVRRKSWRLSKTGMLFNNCEKKACGYRACRTYHLQACLDIIKVCHAGGFWPVYVLHRLFYVCQFESVCTSLYYYLTVGDRVTIQKSLYTRY